jgi:formylglycine-generating enzyme required for sulfatase activity
VASLLTITPRATAQATAPATRPAAGAAAAAPGKPFTETIPGTLVTFEMRPVSARPAAGDEPAIKPFWIGKAEVAWDEFDVFVFRLDLTEKQKAEGVDAESRPSKPYGAPDRGFGHQGYPALGMTYHSAQQYCRWLSNQTGRKYRLPTEAEWRHACAAGKVAAADDAASLDKAAWYWDNAEDKTHPVATKAPNAWGVHDALGNVAEWATAKGEQPVALGGSYDDEAADVSCAARKMQTEEWNVTDPQNPKSRWWLSDAPFIGFRVVCEE